MYLFACKERHNAYTLEYNDIDDKLECNITGDALNVSLKPEEI